MANEVTFKINIDGNMHAATVEATEFGRAVEQVKSKIDKLTNDKLNFAAMVTACEAVTNALSRISGAVGELTKTNGLFLTNSKKPYHFLWLHRMISKNLL